MERELFDNNREIISTLDFSISIHAVMPSLKIGFPIDDCKALYKVIRSSLPCKHFAKDFIEKGFRSINNALKKNTLFYSLNPKSVDTLRRIIEAYIPQQMVPWLPMTLKNKEDILFYDWSTVNPKFIKSNFAPLFRERIKCYKNSQNLNIVKIDVGNHKSLGLLGSQYQDFTEVEFSEFVARKYLMLLESADRRQKEFTISLMELYCILKPRRCFYTGEKLVIFKQEGIDSNDLPDNYLTLDRVDNSKGYTADNVMVCGKSVNHRKGSMGIEAFNSTLLTDDLVESLNFDEAQRALFIQLCEIGKSTDRHACQ
jgi:hypothetical protein